MHCCPYHCFVFLYTITIEVHQRTLSFTQHKMLKKMPKKNGGYDKFGQLVNNKTQSKFKLKYSSNI